jgi:hypothetical protein
MSEDTASFSSPASGPPEDTASFSSPEDTHDSVEALSLSVGALQMDKVLMLTQIGNLQAQFEALLSLNTPATAPAAAAVPVAVAMVAPAAVAALDLDPVCRVNQLTQRGQLDVFTESRPHSGPDNERLHFCSWTNVVTGQVVTASAGTVRQAKKECAQLYLEHFA